MRLSLLPIGLAGVLWASAALAQDACDRNDDSQNAMTICAGLDHDAADARLNRSYGDLMKALGDNAKSKKLLQTAQRAWIAFRDAECGYSTADSQGGSIHPMEVSICLTQLTNDRIKQLAIRSNCDESDVNCASPGEDESDDIQ